jgi:hypothetical protein
LCSFLGLNALTCIFADGLVSRYTRDEEELEGLDRVGEDSGWKQVHGDVFRKPRHLPLFAALVGTGWQLIIIILSAVLFAILGEFHGEVSTSVGFVRARFTGVA